MGKNLRRRGTGIGSFIRKGSRVLAHSALLVLLVFAVSVVVAVSSKEMGLTLPGLALTRTGVLAVRVLGAAAAVVGLFTLLGIRNRFWQGVTQGTDPTVGSLRTAASTMGLLTIAALLFSPPIPKEAADTRPCLGVGCPEPSPPSEEEYAPGGNPSRGGRISGTGGLGGRGGRSGSRLTDLVPAQSSGPENLGLLVRFRRYLTPVFFLLATAVLLAYLRRSMRQRKTPDDLFLSATEAEDSLEASLSEVIGAGGDPRQQVTASYFRLLAALAEAGAPRLPQEAPHEYLQRVLGPLGVRPAPLHDLADLYVLAQFSERPITEDHRAAAALALELSLADLRGVHPASGTAHSLEVVETPDHE